jgi:hypothetical protein
MCSRRAARIILPDRAMQDRRVSLPLKTQAE